MKKLFLLFVIIIPFIPAVVFSSSGVSVPEYLVYHSKLYDDGGNPLGDGEIFVEFRISDARGDLLYEESQEIEIVRGGISALIGGGMSQDILEPDGPRYIEVVVDGVSVTDPLEIASVPYAIYAQNALGVGDGVVDSASIRNGGVEFDDLSDALVERLGEELSRGGVAGGLVSQGYLESVSGASAIGVTSNFSYSGANNLQGVLADFDRAIRMRDENTRSSVEAEAAARIAADNTEALARATADTVEAAARVSADNTGAAARVVNTNRIVALEGAVGSITAPPERPEYEVRAWGADVYCNSASQSANMSAGGNVTAGFNGSGECRVTFVQPMQSANYAVNITPLVDQLYVWGKSADGFTVRRIEWGSEMTFDFTVAGP